MKIKIIGDVLHLDSGYSSEKITPELFEDWQTILHNDIGILHRMLEGDGRPKDVKYKEEEIYNSEMILEMIKEKFPEYAV